MKFSIKRVLSIILVTLFLFSCRDESKDTFILGTITNLDKGTPLFLDHLTPSKIITKDTAILDINGRFSFDSRIKESGYYRLKINNQTFLNLVLEKNDSPIINGNGKDLMESYTVDGSNESKRLKEFQAAYSQNDLFLDSLQKVLKANLNDQKMMAQLQKSKDASISRMNNTFIGLINEKSGSLVSLAVVQKLDSVKYADFYKQVAEALTEKLYDDPWVIVFHKKVKSMDNLSIGKPAPEITLNDPQGNSISLSSLKGKVVLIDFWASWCRPCRMENPNVVKVYNKYKTKGFDVLSISLDGVQQQQTPKQDWINAISSDGLIWKNHVSDLKGWNSSMVPLYGLKSIPFTLLIDKEGNILGQNLRGKELEHKLVSIFN
jgi:thiol-disulfide isomerase/thioredoxin